MSAFSPEWLALREGADARARDASLAGTLLATRPPGQPLRVVDLGSGSGANLRYLAPRLGHGQHWLLIDYDSAKAAMLTFSKTLSVELAAQGVRH